MTAMTAVIVDALQKKGPVRCLNWSRGKPLKGWRWRLARIWGAFKSIGTLIASGPARGAVLYYTVSAGPGLYYDLAIATTARLLGYRLVFHHHTYAYIDRYNWRVALLDRLAGSSGAHAVCADLMRNHFLEKYDSKAEFLTVPPTIVSQQLEAADAQPRDHFTLGFMSNLTLVKGLDDAIAVFERLAVDGRRVRLILAGPCMTDAERALVDAALGRWPDQMEYRGPVYGREKAQFFADIDVFLFPTRYPNESWGIVLTEALSVGRPVITRSRGCIPWMVRDGCGLVVAPDADFVSPAADQIGRWMDQPATFEAAQAAARKRSHELNEDATAALPAFVDRMHWLSRSSASLQS
jgi:glycosyltransferase involved in cell wall biosynthesis